MQKRNELKELFKLGMPAILAQLSQMSLGVIDTMMAGRINPEALAAIAVGTNLFNPLMVFVLGIFFALNPIIAHLNGRGDFAKIGQVFQHSIIIAALITLPCFFLVRNTEGLMTLLDIQPVLIPTVLGYLEACSWGLLPLFLFLVLRFCNEGLFATKAIMLVSLSAIPFNVVFNYWFIWGGFGVPPMGAVGVGYATSLVWLVMFIGMLSYTLVTKRYQHLQIKSKWHSWDNNQVKEIFKLGLPMGITVGMEIAMFAFIGLLIGRYAIEMVAAHQVAINIASMAYMIPLGLSIAISARVGYFAGKKDPTLVRYAGYMGISLAIGMASLSALGMFIYPRELIHFYTPDKIVIEVAVQLLFFAAVFQLSDAIQVAVSGALRGLKDTQIPMIISAIAYWAIGFPIGFYYAEVQGMQALGYWIGIIAGLSCSALLMSVRFWWKVRRLTFFN